MGTTEDYLKKIAEVVKTEKVTRNKESKVAKEVLKVVQDMMTANETTTINHIATKTKKSVQHIHSVVRNNPSILTKVRIEKRVLIVPTATDTTEVKEG